MAVQLANERGQSYTFFDVRTSPWLMFVCTLIAMTTGGAIAQNAPVHNIHPGSVEIAWHVSQLPPPTAIPDPRFAERLTDSGTSNGQTWYELSARLYWTRVMSTIVEAGATTWGIREYDTRSPVLPLAFDHNTLQHRRAVSVVQSVDVVPWRRIVPWVGGGAIFHRTSSRECVISSGRGFAGCARRLTKDTAAIVAGGVKVYVHRHAFVSANGAVPLGKAPEEGVARHWQIGGGASF